MNKNRIRGLRWRSGNVFLLIRHTGMRIGECADLSCDCLRSTAPQQWAIHVPLGKLNTERMVPVDSFVGEVVQRLAFFRSLDPLPADGWLLARPRTKEALVRQLRDYLHQVCHSLALSIRIVPHQLRHYSVCPTITGWWRKQWRSGASLLIKTNAEAIDDAE
jgi:integrase